MDYTVTIDTETTGLLKPLGTPLYLCPHIIEIYAAQRADGKIIKEIDTLVKPPIPIPLSLTKKVHGISDQMVKDSPTFLEIFKELVDVFLGAEEMVAANLMYDQSVLVYELRRIGEDHHFPYPPQRFCTIEQSIYLRGYRLKNSDLYKIVTGKNITGIHRAKNDATATWENYKWLKDQEAF